MTTDGRVLAGGLVLADIATQGSVTWPALAMVVVGLALAVVGLAILTGRGRSPWDASSRSDHPSGAERPSPLFTARSQVPAPARAPTSTASPDEPAPAEGPAVEQAVAPAVGRREVAPPPHEEPAVTVPDEPTGEIDGGPCDWEFRVDVSDDDPVVVREAAGRPCCVHVLRVRSLDALPEPREQDDRTWSGERTRIGPSRAVSDVRRDLRVVRPAVHGLDLALDATLSRQDQPSVVTTVEDAAAEPEGHTAAEKLWTAHLAHLREADVVSDPGEGPARLQTATRHRTEVGLRASGACRTAGHRLEVSADVSVDVDGEVTPASGTRLALPNVVGWVEGGLAVAASDPVEVSPGTEVHPAPGLDGVAGLAVGAAPGSGELRATFAGHAETTVSDGGIDLLVAGAAVADVGLGEVDGHPAAQGRVRVAVGHRVRFVVTPHGTHVGADVPAGSDLGCTCAPAYEVQFGVAPGSGAQAPPARIHVDGRSFRLDVDARPGADRVPSWTVRADDGDEPTRGTTG